MAQSQLLDIVQAASNQANLYTTINDIVEAFEFATQRFLEISLDGASGEYEMDMEDFTRRVAFRFIEAESVTDFYMPALINGNDANRMLAVINASGAAIQFISTENFGDITGETVTLADGESCILIIERDNVYQIGSGSGGGGGGEMVSYSFFYEGTPATGQYIYGRMMEVDPEVNFAGNFAGSYGRVLVNPTATVTLNVQRRATGGSFFSIGTIVISTAGVVTFTTSSGLGKSLVQGEGLYVKNDGAADATMSGLSVTFTRES